ncbi:MAG TPA: hypothetical protein VFV85_09140, partial [Conexibacter sp.]|nr:hypothetical protein [Conexibacter sp.]
MPANPVRSRRLLAVLLSLASLFLLTVPGVALASHHPHHHKAGPKAAAARLNHAARKARVADHRLVTKAHQL